MSSVIQLSEIEAKTICIPDDESFTTSDIDQTTREMKFEKFTCDDKIFNISFDGTVSTNGISVSEFTAGKPVLAIGVIIPESCVTGFNKMKSVLSNYMQLNFLEEWQITDPVRNDRVYIKFGFDPKTKRQKFSSNISINLKKPQDAAIFMGQQVSVRCTCGVYFNFQEKKAGVCINSNSFTFEK